MLCNDTYHVNSSSFASFLLNLHNVSIPFRKMGKGGLIISVALLISLILASQRPTNKLFFFLRLLVMRYYPRTSCFIIPSRGLIRANYYLETVWLFRRLNRFFWQCLVLLKSFSMGPPNVVLWMLTFSEGSIIYEIVGKPQMADFLCLSPNLGACMFDVDLSGVSFDISGSAKI